MQRDKLPPPREVGRIVFLSDCKYLLQSGLLRCRPCAPLKLFLDSFHDDVSSLSHRMPISPISSEASGAGGGEHGLAEPLQDDRNLGQPVLAAVDLRKQHLQFRYDAPLLGERSKGEIQMLEVTLADGGECRTCALV